MCRPIALISLAVAVLAATGCGGAEARLQLANQTSSLQARAPSEGKLVQRLLADGASLRIKMLAVYLAEDVDPVTQDNRGNTAMIWLEPQCGGSISSCNVEGMAEPAGPRVTEFFDFARPSAEVNAALNAQGARVKAGTYRYARVEFCKAVGGQTLPGEPTVMWKAPGMSAEQPFTSGDCGRTSRPFSPPLELGERDNVEVTLGYDLAQAIAVGAPDRTSPHCSFAIAGHLDGNGQPHCFRACVDVDASTRACMDFPEFSPSASKS